MNFLSKTNEFKFVLFLTGQTLCNIFTGHIETQSETSNQYRASTAGTTKRRERLLRPPSNISRSLGDAEFYEQVA